MKNSDQHMPKPSELFKKYGLTFLSGILFAFIILFPKLPLLDIFATWVYIRLEDILVVVAAIALLFVEIKSRSVSKTPLTIPITIYWFVGFISVIVSLLFIGPHLANYFPHLTILHFLRRIEYMVLFFLTYRAFRRESGIWVYISILALVAVVIVVYGLAQKFFGFPAFLTMNEEFAKGIPLRLPPTARIPSTFGGHYDLAAYLVLTIPIFGSLIFGISKIWQKLLFFCLALGSYILLLFTASRVSFGVYLIAISSMLVWQKKKWLILPTVVVSFFLLNYISGASERFYKTFRFSDVIVDLSTGLPVGTLESIGDTSAVVETQERPDEENLPKGSGFIAVGSGSGGKTVKTIEVYRTKDLATGSGEIATISGSFLIQKALVYDISITTRFQGQWPKAIAAFKRNIIIGSGFSTLSVASDGDYLRMLGETGILGLVSFMGIFLYAFSIFYKQIDNLKPLSKSFVIGVFAGLVGLLVNAVLIDVFEASKVAYALWFLLGIAMAILGLGRIKRAQSYFQFMKQLLTSYRFLMLLLGIISMVIWSASIGVYFTADDFTWLKWAATTGIAHIPDFFVDADEFFYRPIPKAWYTLLYTFFWLKPTAYHVMSLLLYAVSCVSVFFIARRLRFNKWLVFGVSVLFAALSIHHENVYWISGQSSLLSGTAFLVGLVLFFRAWSQIGIARFGITLVGCIMLAVSMFSYEGAIVFPIIVWILALRFGGRKTVLDHALLLLIPFYWYMRTGAGSYFPQGDYGYNTEKLLINSAANASGYFISILLGPDVITFWENLRLSIKAYPNLVLRIIIIIGTFMITGAVILRRKLILFRDFILFMVVSVISLSAYLGLGGMAERYAYISSAFLVLGIGCLLTLIWEKSRNWLMQATVIGLLIALIVINLRILQRISGDWQLAGETVQKSLLTVKKQYFPLISPKTFVFVNTPIRAGRAWIFPLGMSDALWHMFRDTPNLTGITSADSIDAAFKLQTPGYSYEVLIFENLVLKGVSKETQIVEADSQ